MKNKTLLLVLSIIPFHLFCQQTIVMEEQNGIYMVPCKINDVPMKFIFDTGASNVSISRTEAVFLIKQNLLNKEDIIGKARYQIANGDIEEGTEIILRKIEIGDTTIKNIGATVVDNESAPLLLGQSAIRKLGGFSIHGNQLIIGSSNNLRPDNLTSALEVSMNHSLNPSEDLINYGSESYSAYNTIEELRNETIKYYNEVFMSNYNRDNMKVFARTENQDLNIVFFEKEHEDVTYSSEQDESLSRESLQKNKSFAFHLLTKFICNTDEKKDLFMLNNYSNLLFTFQTITESGNYDTQLEMKVLDYNLLGDHFSELEFRRILK